MVDTDTPQDTPSSEEKPIQAPMHVAPPDDPEIKDLWETYLQKCCEVGQLEFQLSQMDSQRRQMEKNLEVTQQLVKKAAAAHDKRRKEIMSKDPKAEVVQ